MGTSIPLIEVARARKHVVGDRSCLPELTVNRVVMCEPAPRCYPAWTDAICDLRHPYPGLRKRPFNSWHKRRAAEGPGNSSVYAEYCRISSKPLTQELCPKPNRGHCGFPRTPHDSHA